MSLLTGDFGFLYRNGGCENFSDTHSGLFAGFSIDLRNLLSIQNLLFPWL
jgi:hypothetical protein